MPESDDFGLDDDETEFIAAATQFEASQNDDFDPSPRPAKRRRVSQRDAAGLHETGGEALDSLGVDGEFQSPPTASTSLQSTTADHQGSATQDGSDVADEYSEYRYFPGELDVEENASKKSRYRIHIPDIGGKFPDMIFTQTQHGLDDDMSKFRGAVWKRPPVQALPANVGGIANANGYGKGAIAVANGITNYFRATGRTNSVDDDAALAAHLQAEEDTCRKRLDTDRIRPMTSVAAAKSLSQQQIATQLANLPDDAFSSSSPEKSPAKDVIELSSQFDDSQTQRSRPQALRAPQTGLRQLDLWGQATQEMTTSQAVKKKHAWPLASREEPPTHHRLDSDAMKTWVYPTNLGTVRDYQFNIVSRSLFHNTLVALPTGLGKTFIAATVMLNYYRWTTDAKLVFMAPTKPLIAQQMDACYGVVGIPRPDTVLMTGETAPARRADAWQQKRVFFMTPQTVINDLRTGICDPKKIVLLIVDEAHKATGGYAYAEVITFLRRFNSSFRVLALTATPGSTTEAVQAVIDNLGISRVELRTESSLDIRAYTHEKHTENELFDFSDEQERIMDLMSKALRPALDKLNTQNAYWSRDPMQLTAYGLTTARQKWMQSEAGRRAPQPVKGMVNSIFTALSSLAHSITLLKHHGIGPFYSGVLAFQKSVDSGENKGKTATGIVQSDHFTKMISTMRSWTNSPEFIGHPKLEYLREVVLNHFLDAGEGRQGTDVPPSATRVMIFASYRDSTDEICRVLKRSEPMIRPHVFVGQAASKGQEGMDQKRQNAVIQDFKSGKFNTLVATSIGEEGLDIGTVDLIVCYDASASPIRMLQRIGRTGRKRVGRVVLLLMKGKEEKDYEKAQDNYLYIQKTIADAAKYSYRDDQSPRILPKDAKPVADKRPVEIPIENSQPVDLNEKGKKAGNKAKAKRPPKKFHMPDGVRTGFTKASRLCEDSDSGDIGSGQKRPGLSKAVVKRQQTFVKPRGLPSLAPGVESAPLPYLTDVFLKAHQLAELQEKYARAADGEQDLEIRPPDYERFPDKLREFGRAKYVLHGKKSKLVEATMKAMRMVDTAKCQRFDEIMQLSDLEDGAYPSVPVLPESSAKRSRCRPTAKQQHSVAMSRSPSFSDDDLATGPPLRPHSSIKRPRGRPRKKQTLQRATSYGSAAAEGAESSPEPTPAHMRIGTQGEDLGSRDTSGEDEEEQPNSDDIAFIARSSAPIEKVSSESDSDTICDLDDEREPVRKRTVRRKVIEETDDEDD